MTVRERQRETETDRQTLKSDRKSVSKAQTDEKETLGTHISSQKYFAHTEKNNGLRDLPPRSPPLQKGQLLQIKFQNLSKNQFALNSF